MYSGEFKRTATRVEYYIVCVLDAPYNLHCTVHIAPINLYNELIYNFFVSKLQVQTCDEKDRRAI
jgi:hypothetical protein